jgi:hypothetical protein
MHFTCIRHNGKWQRSTGARRRAKEEHGTWRLPLCSAEEHEDVGHVVEEQEKARQCREMRPWTENAG